MSDAGEKSQKTIEEKSTTSRMLFLVLIFGFALVFVGIIVILIATVLYGGGSAATGAVIFIGPFPIVIGASPDVTWIVLFSIILAVLSVAVFLVMNRKISKFDG